MNNKSFLSYNMLYDPILTAEQIKACHFYLTPNFDLNDPTLNTFKRG